MIIALPLKKRLAMLNMDDLLASPDERTLKRHYARLLKVTRPDDNPVAFQHLREAYKRTLQRLRDGDSFVAPAIPPALYEHAIALLAEFDLMSSGPAPRRKGVPPILSNCCSSAASTHPIGIYRC